MSVPPGSGADWAPMKCTTRSIRARHRRTVGSLLSVALILAACSAQAASPTAGSPSATPVAMASGSAPATSLPTAAPSGFAFSADGVLGYYQTLGYTCGDPQPSTTAAGYTFRSCTSQDPAGRTLAIGVVTDPQGALSDAFASVQGTAQESILDPTNALDPLSAFLGATLGSERGSALLTWLAGHLGDDFAETKSADLTIATYTASSADHSRLYVEVANVSYLDAPTPSPSA